MRIMLLVSDRMMCDGLRALLTREASAEVVGESLDGQEALGLVRQLRPDLVLADTGAWTSGSFETIRQIVEEFPEIKIIALSAFCNRALVAEAFRSGAHGYVLKQNGFDELIQAIDAVCSGSTYLCSRATQGILDSCIAPQSDIENSDEPALTDRECVVLQMLAEGRSAKEIAYTLHVSSKTIDACRRQIMRKLGVDSVAGLVKQALVLGLTTLSA